jgi:hypothetical protein
MKPFDIIIRRSFKHELAQAIQDLEDRGFIPVSDVIEQKEDRKDWIRRDRRLVFSQNCGQERYMVKMRKVNAQ